MKSYRIAPDRILVHNGKRYEGGQVVELDDAAARPLLDLGAILEYDLLAPKNPEPEAEAEATLEAEAPSEVEVEREAAPRRRGRPRR